MLAIIRRTYRLIALLGLLTISGVAFAQTTSTQSIGTITNAASNGTDKSMSALQLIYGPVAENPLSGGSTSSSSTSSGLISQVFLVLNSCILAVGVIWAMYHFGSAMIATGQDGEFLGQKKSSPWFIIRMGVGFAGLVPMFGGYCGAQIIMLWGTMMGVGVANLALSAAVSVLTSGGTLVATPIVPQVTTLARSLFEANLCAAAANQAINNLPNDANVTADSGETFSPNTTASKIVLMNQNGLSCGGAEINATATSSTSSTSSTTTSASALLAYAPDTSSVASSLVSAQQSALVTMQSTLSSAAQTYVSAVNNQTQPADPQATIEGLPERDSDSRGRPVDYDQRDREHDTDQLDTRRLDHARRLV
jgi:conjugal transfer/type IV secretion protein DotA/TraY